MSQQPIIELLTCEICDSCRVCSWASTLVDE